MRTRIAIAAGALALGLAAAPCSVHGSTYYSWTTNDWWTALFPDLQTLTLQPGDELWIGPGGNPGEKHFGGGAHLTNYGLITWDDTRGMLRAAGSSSVENHGLLDLRVAGTFWAYPGFGAGNNTLTNAADGTLRKSLSDSDVTIPYTNNFSDETRFINAGTLECQVGRLVYNAPLAYFQPGTHFTGAGTHRVSVTNVTEFNGDLTVAPGTTVDFDTRPGTGSPWSRFNGTPATLHGTVRLVHGDLWGTWVVAPDGALVVVDGQTPRLDATVDNRGVISLDGSLQAAGTVTNSGLVDFRQDGIRFGRQDAGWLSLQNKGVVRKSAGAGRSILGTEGQAEMNFSNDADGLVAVDAGTLAVCAPTFTTNLGCLRVAAGARLDIETWWPNPLTNHGTAEGAGTLALFGGQPFVNQGLVLPASADVAGVLTLDGAFAQTSGGELRVELAGAADGQFDRLAVTGAATLGGTLRVRALGGYVPADGATFPILTAAARNGVFATVTNELPAGLSLEVLYGETCATLVVHGAPAGVAPSPVVAPALAVRRDATGAACIALVLGAPATVRLTACDVSGRRIGMLDAGTLGAGEHTWRWPTAPGGGEAPASGVYFIRAEVIAAEALRVLSTRFPYVR